MRRPGPINHGTLSGYTVHRKRGEQACAECREAKRVREAELRAERAGRLDQLAHPSHLAWDAGCRCAPCREWKAAYRLGAGRAA